MKPNCTCVIDIEKQVAKDKDAESYSMNINLFTGCTISEGELILKNGKKKKLTAIHTHCPFCGKKYK